MARCKRESLEMSEDKELQKSLELLKKKAQQEMKIIKENYEISIGPDRRILERAKQSFEKKTEVHKRRSKKEYDALYDKVLEKYYDLLSFHKIAEEPVDRSWFFDKTPVETHKKHTEKKHTEKKENVCEDSED